jgi:hypothetical protein
VSVLTLALAKTHLNIPATVVTQDTELQTVIDAAEAAIVQACGGLEAASTSSRVRGGTDRLVLPVPPVISLTSVTPVGGTALTVGDLMVSASGVVEYTAGGFFSDRWYDVVYSAGRASCPADLLLAVRELVRHIWDTQRGGTRRPGSSTSSETANTIAGAAYLFPFRVEQLLAPYIQPGFA